MHFRVLILVTIFVPLIVSCSTTPGDAAYRGGHPEQAANLYKKGAEQGDSSAALKLGLMVSESIVSSSIYGDAIKWFVRACELGSNTGCHNSGNAFEYGNAGANKDYDKARNYFTLAAEKGYMQSQYNLGSLYSNQYFNNDVEGLKWMFIAERTANNCSSEPLCQWVIKDPPGHRSKLVRRMNNSQTAESRQKAKEWKVKK